MSASAVEVTDDETVTPSTVLMSDAGHAVARNTLLNLVGQVLPLALGLLTLPIVVRGLGPGRFGILTFAWTLIGYLSVFDLGLTRATVKTIAELRGSAPDDRIARIAWTTIVTQTLIGSLGGVVLLVTARPIVERVLHVPASYAAEALGCFTLLAFAVPIQLLTNSLRGLLEAAQRFDLVNAVRIPLQSFYFLLPAIGVMLRWSLPQIMGSLIIAWAIGLVGQFAMCARVYPRLRWPPHADRSEIVALLRYGGWVTVSSIISPLLVYTDRLMIGAMLSIVAVGYYSAPFDVVTRLLVIPASLVATLFPVFAAGSDVVDAGRRLLVVSTKYLVLLVVPPVLAILLLSRDILGLWLGPDYAAHSALPLRLLAIGVLVNSLAQIPFSFLQARGYPDVAAKFHLAELPLHLLALWLGIRFYGIAGAAFAWTFRVTIDAALLYTAAARRAPGAWRDMRAAHIPVLVSTVVVVGAAALIVEDHLPLRMERAAVVASALALIGIVTWLFALSPAERSAFSVRSAQRLVRRPRSAAAARG